MKCFLLILSSILLQKSICQSSLSQSDLRRDNHQRFIENLNLFLFKDSVSRKAKNSMLDTLTNWTIKTFHQNQIKQKEVDYDLQNDEPMDTSCFVIYMKLPEVKLVSKVFYNDSETQQILIRHLNKTYTDSIIRNRFFSAPDEVSDFAKREFNIYELPEIMDVQKKAEPININNINLEGGVKILRYSDSLLSVLDDLVLKTKLKNRDSELSFLKSRILNLPDENGLFNTPIITEIVFDKDLKYVKITYYKKNDYFRSRIYEINYPVKQIYKTSVIYDLY